MQNTTLSLTQALITSFGTGLVVSLTPCVYPLIPITISILQRHAEKSFWGNFINALAYVLGISMVYATLGYIAATSSIMFGSWTNKPYIIIPVLLIFLYLALSMLDVFEIKFPSFSMPAQKEQSTSLRWTVIKTFVYGLISGTVASPCLTPALAVTLGLAAKQGSPVAGFFIMLAFSLGMSSILLLVGIFSGSLALLPQAGEWMNIVKNILGFFMLALCAFFALPLIGLNIVYACYALVCLSASIFFLKRYPGQRFAIICAGGAFALFLFFALRFFSMIGVV